jgi:hypothetical protein
VKRERISKEKALWKAFVAFSHQKRVLVFLPDQEMKEFIQDNFLSMVDDLWNKKNFRHMTWGGMWQLHASEAVSFHKGSFVSTPIHETYLCGRGADVIITDEKTFWEWPALICIGAEYKGTEVYFV